MHHQFRWLIGAGFGVLLAFGAGGDGLAQDAIEIRADGPNVTDSAAGADNVRVELNPGRQQAAAGQGRGNEEIRRAPRQDRDHNRDRNRDRAGNNGGGRVEEAAPAAAPAEGAASEQQAAAAAATAGGSETRPVRLPATGAGAASTLPIVLALFGAGSAAAGAGWVIRRRR